MTDQRDQRIEAAIGWLAKTNDADFSDWDGFTAWLEADPRNADVWHKVAESEAIVTPLIAELGVAQVPERPRWQWAVAAGVAALGAFGLTAVPVLVGKDYSTMPGETRTIALAAGDELVLNGGTAVHLAGLGQRDIRLERGQLLVRLHGPGHRGVEVQSGDLKVTDVGTVFEVSRTGHSTRVVVAEGAVIADPDGARLRLASGEKLETEDGAARLRAEPALRESVGAWQHGQLAYLDEPIATVAADLRRSTGIDFSASGAMGSRRFSGTLSLAEVKRDPAGLGPLLGVSVTPSGTGWRLGERP